MDSLVDWFMGWAEHGPLLFALAYFIATLLPLPTTPFTLAAGALFGFGPGMAVVAGAPGAGRRRLEGVTLFQLSPILPFGLQNYFLGASHLRLGHFVSGTAVAMLPLSSLFVFAGARGREAMTEGGGAQWGLMALGLAAAVLLAWRLGKRSTSRLQAGD